MPEERHSGHQSSPRNSTLHNWHRKRPQRLHETAAVFDGWKKQVASPSPAWMASGKTTSGLARIAGKARTVTRELQAGQIAPSRASIASLGSSASQRQQRMGAETPPVAMPLIQRFG